MFGYQFVYLHIFSNSRKDRKKRLYYQKKGVNRHFSTSKHRRHISTVGRYWRGWGQQTAMQNAKFKIQNDKSEKNFEFFSDFF